MAWRVRLSALPQEKITFFFLLLEEKQQLPRVTLCLPCPLRKCPLGSPGCRPGCMPETRQRLPRREVGKDVPGCGVSPEGARFRQKQCGILELVAVLGTSEAVRSRRR